ncbi:TolC family protein [Dyella choica]|uniref:Protein CyaE n=1 Tax=Dyella choica TaxID=1927959 RepID=A0A432MA63_9GAMM|nr:TolC family protein [Dyella choica]RUL79073.1 TolC family protein [Dyella choica]
MAPPAPDHPWSPTVDATGALTAAPASSAAAPSQGYVLPPNPAGATLPATTVDSQRVYQLADLIDLAESTNPETRIAWNEARNAALTAGIARSAYLPRISATALGARQQQNGRNSGLGASVAQNNSFSGGVAVLSLEWLLFDFGQRHALVNAADEGAVIANIAFTGAHQRLIHAVSVAFYAYSAASARTDTAAVSLKDAQDIQIAAESRKKHGIGTVIEVAQARQLTAQAELAKVDAEGDKSNAYFALLSAIGVSPLTHIQIADVSKRPLPSNLDQPIDHVLADALERRPDVLAAIAQQKAADAGVRAAQADFLPKFFVSASGTHANGNVDLSAVPAVGDQAPTVNLSNHHWGATVIVGVTIPLYNGGVRNAALAQARNRADSAAEALDRVKLDAAQEVAMADSKLHTSLAAVSATRVLLDASQVTYDAALAAFRRGVGSSTDMLVAERQLLEARNAAVDAHSAALSAAATLALVCGSLGQAPN